MDNKMSSTAKFCEKKKFLKRSQAKTKIKYIKKEILSLKEKFMKLEEYRIEISHNSYILFNKEKDYLNLLEIENQIRYLFKDLFQGKCDKKEIYNNIDVIKKNLYTCELEEVEIFYNPYESENPFRVKFPFICFYEDEEKKDNLNYCIKNLKMKNWK